MPNIDSDLIRGNIDTIILKTMLENDMYGLDIIKEVETRSNGTYILKQPTLYSCLKRLENQELISSYWLDSDIGGRRHYYKLTDKGRETLVKKQEEWAKSKFIIDNLLSGYNYDEYRLVKKEDYDKIIEGKTFSYEKQSPAPVETAQEITAEEVETPDEDFESTNDDSDIEDFNNLESSSENETYDEFEASAEAEETEEPAEYMADEVESSSEDEDPETEEDERFYFDSSLTEENEDVQEVVPDADQTEQESNILAMLRHQDDEEINTYYGDQKSYTNHLNINDEYDAVQQNLLDGTDSNSGDDVDKSIQDFNDAIKRLSMFNKSDSQSEPEEPDFETQKFNNFEDLHEEIEDENLLIEAPEVEFDDEFAKELSCLKCNKNTGFFNSYDNPDYDVVANKVSSPAKDTENYDYNQTDSSDASYEYDDGDSFEFSQTTEDESFEDSFSFESTEETSADDEEESTEEDVPAEITEVPELFDYSSLDQIISSNANNYQSQYTASDNDSFVTFKPTYTGKNYKQKLSDLSAYSKVSLDEDEKVSVNEEALKKAKDIESLKTEFEKEGIKIKEFRKYNSCEQCEKTYVLSNKMKFINSLILLFGYVFLLSAVYIILNNTSFKDSYGFSFKYFLYGFIPFVIYAGYHTVMYLINPYKKVPAKLAPRIMIFISLIITVQLLLITYCMNLQFGFYSFVQEQYNHLLWIIPTIISFAPIICNAVYIALFYSKNFNV